MRAHRTSAAIWLLGALMLWGAAAGAQEETPAEQPAQPPQLPASVPVRQLSHETYQLSCIDMQSCIEILGQLGYTTKPPGAQAQLAQLPAVFAMPSVSPKSIIVDPGQVSKTKLSEETLSAPEHRLIILYHESQSEEVARLRDLLEGTIDVPERMVLIEGMVIELTEDLLKELGVEFAAYGGELQWGEFAREAGRTGDSQVPLYLFRNRTDLPAPADLRHRVQATIRAAIQEGRAEVLSSPSVLVLNNQNANIQVTSQLPIFKTIITERTTKIDIGWETVGIIMNIKPRVSNDGSTIAMQVLVEVSESPEFLTVVTGEEEQAIAPLIDRRVVQTVARVQDNTPFIIGGLIRNEKTETTDRIPILSRIPLLGNLFQSKSDRREKREVIIVLTPRVIEAGGTQRPVLPKDSEQFDFLDNRLFRNAYRLKAEDIFDLAFLEENPTILDAMARVRRFVAKHPEYRERSPFREMSQGSIPGEDAVVVRMIYEVAKKLGLHEQLKTERMIVFEADPEKPAGFDVTFLKKLLEKSSPDGTVAGYFARPYPKEVLLFRYNLPMGDGMKEVLCSPVAHLERKTVQSRDEVEDVLLEINRLHDDYTYHEFAFVLDSEKDLVRLKAAVALREIAKVNNFEDLLVLRNFRVGRKVVMPEVEKNERVFLVDHEVAECFFKSEYYYPALKAKLEQGYRIVEQALAAEEE